MSTLAFRQLRVSDVSGKDLPEDEAISVVIRQHPDLTEGKVFDTSEEELSSLKGVGNLVELELRLAHGSRTLLVTKAEFDKLMPADKLKELPGVRGRRPGYSPSGNGH